jgi:hypothetical protein
VHSRQPVSSAVNILSSHNELQTANKNQRLNKSQCRVWSSKGDLKGGSGSLKKIGSAHDIERRSLIPENNHSSPSTADVKNE